MVAIKACCLCSGREFMKRDGSVRDNPNLDVIECSGCGLVFLSPFSHTKDKFYENGMMHDGDTTSAYEKQLASIGGCDTLLGGFSKQDG